MLRVLQRGDSPELRVECKAREDKSKSGTSTEATAIESISVHGLHKAILSVRLPRLSAQIGLGSGSSTREAGKATGFFSSNGDGSAKTGDGHGGPLLPPPPRRPRCLSLPLVELGINMPPKAVQALLNFAYAADVDGFLDREAVRVFGRGFPFFIPPLYFLFSFPPRY